MYRVSIFIVSIVSIFFLKIRTSVLQVLKSNEQVAKLARQDALSGWRYCQTFFGKPVLSISDFSLIDKPFFLKKHPFGFVNKRKITY